MEILSEHAMIALGDSVHKWDRFWVGSIFDKSSQE